MINPSDPAERGRPARLDATDALASIELPAAARTRLTQAVRDDVGAVLSLGGWHTLPLPLSVWRHYALATGGIATSLSEAIDQGPATSDFDHVQSWLRELLSKRHQLISRVLALSPFAAFEEGAAMAMLGALDWRLLRIVTLIEQAPGALDQTPGFVDLRWLTTAVDDVEPIRAAFGVDDDLYDADGEFSPARVFSAYYLRPAELWEQLAPHLASLGLAAPKDVLVAVSAIGWVLSAPDPVAAYCSMHHLLSSFLCQPSDSPVTAAALGLSRPLTPARVKAGFGSTRA